MSETNIPALLRQVADAIEKGQTSVNVKTFEGMGYRTGGDVDPLAEFMRNPTSREERVFLAKCLSIDLPVGMGQSRNVSVCSPDWASAARLSYGSVDALLASRSLPGQPAGISRELAKRLIPALWADMMLPESDRPAWFAQEFGA